LAPQAPRAAAKLRDRKVWQTHVLQSSEVGRKHGEMALWALEKASFCAIFRHFFIDFPRVFLSELTVKGALGAKATSK
jgi:hypothetical protein